MAVAYREAKPAEINFVTNTWMRSFRDSETAGFIGLHNWAKVAETEIRRILSREGVELYVAYNPEADPNVKADVHGWISVERGFYVPARRFVQGKTRRVMVQSEAPLVHYCFVKPEYRGFGIARGLLGVARVDPTRSFYYSCTTPHSKRIRTLGKIPGGKWDPKICRFPRDHRKEKRFESDQSSKSPILEVVTRRTGRKQLEPDLVLGSREREQEQA